MRMSHLLGAAIAASLLASTALAAGDPNRLVWGGGPQGQSTYTDAYVPAVINAVTNNRLSGYTWAGPSAGTLQNAQAVTEHPTNLALGQWDLLKDLNGKPIPGTDKTYAFTVLAENIGPECLYMVTNMPGYSTLGHVLGNSFDITLATGGDGSGSLATFEHLQSIFPELNDVVVEKVGTATQIVDTVAAGKATHGFFVMRPDPNSETFEKIASLGLTIVPVADYALEDEYTYANLKVSYGKFFWNGDSFVSTACTSVALITGASQNVPADDTQQQRRLAAIIERLQAPGVAETMRPDLASWRDMWDNFKVVSADAIKDILEASKQALEDATKKI